MNYTLSAFHLGSHIDLKAVLKWMKFEILKDEQSFVLVKKDDVSYIYIKDYGSIVFCNFEEEEMIRIMTRISTKDFVYDDLASEEYEIEIDPNAKQQVQFNTVVAEEFSIDILHIVMFNLSQSVAMDNYQMRTNQLLEKTREISDQLKTTGKIGLQRHRLRQFIGRTMVLKTRIAEHLLIFETSDLAWSREKLSDLDSELRNQLDMVNRHHGLQYSLNIVRENLDLFRDILQHKHSSTLEWIIIVLIFLEIIDLVMNKLI